MVRSGYHKPYPILSILLAAALIVSACQPQEGGFLPGAPALDPGLPTPTPGPETPQPTEYPGRPLYGPGELVDYSAQTGDTLPALAARFNTTVEEILDANPFIPASATTMPPGMPMKIPIYYQPLWGLPYPIVPDSLFVNGPSGVGFNTQEFVDAHPGWLRGVRDYVSDSNRTGAQIVDLVALNYSISPRLLLALLEFHSGALSQPEASPEQLDFPLGYRSWNHKGLYLQLAWAANLLNNGYYGWRQARLLEIELKDGRLERLDPWLNAASASLHNYFNFLFETERYLPAISPEGFAATFQTLFGDPWPGDQPHIPGTLLQPEFSLPFEPGHVWALTGGPHTGWGRGEPLAALDFAPPTNRRGCVPTETWATAVAPGMVVRSEVGTVVLDLDGDGDERTGWVLFYLHVASEGRAQKGVVLGRGDPVGHASCEGGSATGTHIHLARKFNGEWLPAPGITEGILAFNLEGWESRSGREAYQGTLVRNGQTITACTCSNAASFVYTDRLASQ